MLTWRERTGFFLDLETLAIKRTFEFSTTKNEGWGIFIYLSTWALILTISPEFFCALPPHTRRTICPSSCPYVPHADWC